MRLRNWPGFRLFWTAFTVSGFGSQVTTFAVAVLIVTTLGGTAADVGLVNAARWLPYLLLGMVVGALVDRVRRKPLLVGADLTRAALLGAVPLLAVPDLLSVPVLIAIMVLFGLASLVNDAAHQSFLPRLVPRERLPRANARLEQSSAAAETSGPAVAGGLVSWLGAPVAVLVDAASYLASALFTARISVEDPPAPVRGPLLREIREGLRWVQARMNATIRSLNRAAVVIGAPLGGLVADAIGFRSALSVAAAGLVAAALVLAASPFRHA